MTRNLTRALRLQGFRAVQAMSGACRSCRKVKVSCTNLYPSPNCGCKHKDVGVGLTLLWAYKYQ